MNTNRNIVLSAAAVAAMVVAAAGTAARPDTTTNTRIPDTRARRAAVPGRPGLSAPMPEEHARLRVRVRPRHRDMAAGRRPVRLTAALRLTSSAMLAYPDCLGSH